MTGRGIISVLEKDYKYTRWDGQHVTVTKGTQVLVDVENMIACHDNDYFEVDHSDVRYVLCQ